MQRTIIGIFQNSVEAQQAREALLTAGFDYNCIEINDHVDTRDDRLTDGQMTDTAEKPADFLPFPADPDAETDRENRVGKTGAIMTIQAEGTEQIFRATEIMDDFGAMDVNEFSESD